MKLGDSMAPIEAHSVWNDVCPQKTRPPKIGDIPRHVAVDKESPSCSSSRSLGHFLEEKPAKSMLERSTSCQPGQARSKLTEALPVMHDFIESSVTTNSNINSSRISDIIGSKFRGNLDTPQDSSNKVFDDSTMSSDLSILSEICHKNDDTELEILKINPSLRVSESTEETDNQATTCWEDEARTYEVRKDSALYIDERNIESLTLSDNCLATGAAESRSLTRPGSSSPSENSEEINSWKLSKPRARRESSGYFSNLGTFDEDRWTTNTMDLGNQQDLISSRDISRERRTSSTKNRLPLIYNQPQQQQPLQQLPIGSSCAQQSTKVPSLVYPPSDHIEQPLQSFTSPNEFTTAASPKPLRTEMPDIEEQISLDSSNDYNDVVSISSHKDDDLSLKISQLSITNGSGSRDDSPPTIGIEDEENIDESTDSTKNVFNAEDRSGQWSCGPCGQPRTTVKPKNGKIIGEPNGRAVIEEKYNLASNLENNTSHQVCCTFDEAIADEDDNDQVVTAVLEPRKERNLLTDTRKALPKPIKVYQLLSTQSEDRGDDEARIFDRRISLQITRPNEDETIRDNCKICLPKEHRYRGSLAEDKKLIHADSVPILKISRSSDLVGATTERRGVEIDPTRTSGAPEIFSSSGGAALSTEERLSHLDKPSGSTIPAIRPIYPYCPYSPYGSPQGSPRTNRKRPLRESRRVSIDSRQGALQLNQYKLLNNIGQGSYGIVKLAYNEEDDTHYAMKILSKKKLMKKAGIFGRIAPGRKSSSNPLAKVYREIALLKKLDHPNVVKLVEVLDDPDEDNLYLVFELVQKGEVLQIPTDKPLDEETARRYFRDVVMGVEYLHYQRIVHRDIKPSNLLVDSEGRVKIADLGVSAELRAAGELLSGSAGTPAFAAPETSTPGAEYSGTLCDVWSMGVTLYCLVTGKVPWDGSGSIIGVQAAIRSEQLRFPEKPRLSEDLYDLLSQMLAKDPAKRIELADIKEHCWLTNNGSEALPSETENCRLPVTVTDEEVARVVTRVPKLDTLILIKTMLKQHSFQNPFLPRRTLRTTLDSVADAAMKKQTSNELMGSSNNSVSLGKNLTTKTDKFHNDGRSNSAPDRYEWHTNGRQMSSDSLLAPVREASSQETELEKR